VSARGIDDTDDQAAFADINHRAVFYCLARRSPFVSVRTALSNMVAHSVRQMAGLLSRVGGEDSDQYGLRVVRKARAVNRLLHKLGLRYVCAAWSQFGVCG